MDIGSQILESRLAVATGLQCTTQSLSQTFGGMCCKELSFVNRGGKQRGTTWRGLAREGRNGWRQAARYVHLRASRRLEPGNAHGDDRSSCVSRYARRPPGQSVRRYNADLEPTFGQLEPKPERTGNRTTFWLRAGQLTQFSREGEGEHEIWDGQQQFLLDFQPGSGSVHAGIWGNGGCGRSDNCIGIPGR